MSESEITPEQALATLDAIASQVPMSRREHQVAVQSVNTLRELILSTKSPELKT